MKRPTIGSANTKLKEKQVTVANVSVHCYSSKDLYHWTDQGIALSVITNNPSSDIAKGCILKRPKWKDS